MMDSSDVDPRDAALLLLKDYLAHRDNFRVFHDFDEAMAEMRISVGKGLAGVAEPLRTVAERLFKISRDGFFLIQVCELKLEYLAEALQHSIEVQNPLSLAGNTRALIEHLGALLFVVETLAKLRGELDGQGSPSKIDEALGKAEATLRRSYFGQSPKGSKKAEAAPHIESECLAAFERLVPDIREVYEFLCEYVHPNYGSNLLVSTGQLGSGRLDPPKDFHKDTVDRICRYCSSAMIFLRQDAVQISAPLILLQDLVDRCFVKGAKINSVFSRRGATPHGDGRSKETAFVFPKARTSQEAIEMTLRFLQESGVDLEGDRQIGAVEGDFIFDVFPTANGPLWFKIPVMKI